MYKKILIILLSSFFITGCWFTSKKQTSKVKEAPPLPNYKNKLTIQIADFKNESKARYLEYLKKTIVPYLIEYISQVKKIRLDEKYRIISNELSIKNYFMRQYKTNRDNSKIIFEILDKNSIPDIYLKKEHIKKRNKAKKKITEEKQEKDRLEKYRKFLVEKYTESSEANKINEKIKEIEKEINERINDAAKKGKPYSAEDKNKLLNTDPRIVALKRRLKQSAYKMGGIQKSRQDGNKSNALINYSKKFQAKKLFTSEHFPISYFIKKSISINKELIEKNKNLNFIGLNIFDYEHKSSLTAKLETNSKSLVLKDFNFDNSVLAAANVPANAPDLIIAGKFEKEDNNISFKIVGFDKNSSRFIFDIKESFSLQSFELEIQKYLKIISKNIVSGLSNVDTNPLIVRTNVDLGIVYLNGIDRGRTSLTKRGQKYAELYIPAVPIGFNMLEVVKKGHFKEKGYVFINPGDNLYSIDINMKELESEISLKILTDPKHASVSVGLDTIKGKPTIAKNLNRGFHRVTVSAPGYETKVISVEVFPNINNIINVKLMKKNKQELTPEQLATRYNFWKNFFFLGGLPFLGGMIFSQIVMDFQFDKANNAYNQALSTSGAEHLYWQYVYTRSDELYNTYVGHNNFFRIGFGAAMLLAGLFQYLESDAMDKDDIGYKIPRFMVDPYSGKMGLGFDIKF